MNKVRLGDIAEINSKTFSLNDFDEILYLDTSSVTKGVFDDFVRLSKDDNIPSRAKRAVKDKTIVYSTVRPNLQHFGILENPQKNVVVSTGFATIDVKDNLIDPKYLYYNLTQDNYTNALHTIATNNVSSYPSINPSDLENLELEILKDIKTQTAIARVLSSIDDKIELNNKTNKELENLTKTIYEYWFVQFDFPNTKGKPYNISGGEMVYNNILKQKIPRSWEVLKLDSIISRIGTGLNPRKNFKLGNGDNYYVTIKNIINGKIIMDDKCDRINDESLKIIDKRSDLQIGDILFTSIEPVGTTYLIWRKPTNWNINESVFTIRPNITKTTPEFLYQLLSSNLMKVFTKNSSAGSVHKGIRHGVLRTFPFAYPKDKHIINDFSMTIRPILERIDNIDQESSNLAQLRDFLLPLLMNGQVKVNIKK